VSLAGTPALPYSDLRQFGPTFLTHFLLRRTPSELLNTLGLALLDTPGMIDSAGGGRGYDYAKVMEWFAEVSPFSFRSSYL